MDYSFFEEYKDLDYSAGEINFTLMSRYNMLKQAEEYFNFLIKMNNGGFFFDKALQIYGFNYQDNFCNISSVNSQLRMSYGKLFEGLTSFGQDLFGNQFSFNSFGNVIFFNSETSEREILAENFTKWIDVLIGDLEYLTGAKLAKGWTTKHSLAYNERLYPKVPFIIGGEYQIENLFALQYPKYIEAYANVANQIHNLPDGTKIEIKIK